MSHVVGTGESGDSLDHLFDIWEITQDPQTKFETKVERLFEVETEAFGLPYAFVSRTDTENDVQRIELAAGSHERLQPGATCPLSESYCRKTIEQPDGVFHVDDARAEGWADDPAYERFGLETYLGARIEVDEETFGTFCFASSTPRDEPTTVEERQLVDLLAMWVSNQLRSDSTSRGSGPTDDLVTSVSHDLRNPLRVAEGRVELLESSVKESVDQIQTAHQRMETIIDQLLVLAQVDEPVAASSPVELGACAGAAWKMVPTEEARLDLSFESRQLVADSDRLENVFENLFRNAVEHGSTGNRTATPSGDSVEHGSTSSRPQAGDAVEHGSTESQSATDGEAGVTVEVGLVEGGFYVADDGPGIPAAEREAVFDPGYSAVAGGTGFGLSIVRRIADAHGWDVRVTDGDTGGARFEFTGVEFVPDDD